MNTEQKDEKFMKLAIEKARRAATPFGAVITMGTEVVVTATDKTPATDFDPVAHAVINAIRQLGALTHKTSFPGYSLYTTCEPCPMCAGAAAWVDMGAIYFAASIADVETYLPQITISCRDIIEHSPAHTSVKGEILREECLRLLESLKNGREGNGT